MTASLEVSVDDGGVSGVASVTFQIQEFRRPQFEVVTRAESAGPHLLTQPVTVAALAQYFSGGVLAGAPTVWQVTTASTTYTPPNWSQFTFGESRPYWLDDFGGGRFGPIGIRRRHDGRAVALPSRSRRRRRTPAPPIRPGPTICSSTSTARSLIFR